MASSSRDFNRDINNLAWNLVSRSMIPYFNNFAYLFIFSQMVSGVSFWILEISLGSVSSSSVTGTQIPSMVFASLIWREKGHLASFPGGVLLVSRIKEFFILACAHKTIRFAPPFAGWIFLLISLARLFMKLFSFFLP